MFSEKVIIVAVSNINFTPKDSESPIIGTKVWYIRGCYDNEKGRGWSCDTILQHTFLRSDSPVVLPEIKSLPVKAEFTYVPQGRYNVLGEIKLV